MKFVLILLALAPTFAFAKFDLNTVESIYCSDSAPSADINVLFSTDGDGADLYPRLKDTIPYVYGNQIWKNNSQAGVMKVVNDPSSENGIVVLQDNFLAPDVVQTLRLTPGKTEGDYSGALSGHVEFKGAWYKLHDHAMDCTVVSPRIPHMGGPLKP